MTPSELFENFRIEVDDVAEPFLWTSGEIDRYMDRAQREFARATDAFLDATTPSVTRVAVSTSSALVALSPLVLKVRRAELVSTSQPVAVSTVAEMDLGAITGRDYGLRVPYRWRTATGTPQFALTDFQRQKLLLVPKPVVADTLGLIVYRLPLETLTNESEELEVIDTDHQEGLLLYMQYLAYLKQDTETYNPKRSAAAKVEWKAFTAEVKQTFKRQRHVHRPVAYGGLYSGDSGRGYGGSW